VVSDLEASQDRSPGDRSQLGAARSAIQEIRSELVETNIALIVHMSRRFVRSGEDLEELLNEGMYRLILCIDNYKPEKGCQFSTYLCRALVFAHLRSSDHEHHHHDGRIDDYATEELPVSGHDIDWLMDLQEILRENRARLSKAELMIITSIYLRKRPATIHQIAAATKLSCRDVQGIHDTAIEKLREVLREK
jgi:RNA polymerase sigma factor (sigma-70 family)